MDNKKFGRIILKKQYEELVKNGSDAGFNVGLIDDDLFKWSVCLFGPNDTIYEGGYFNSTLTFPDDFPQNPPEVRFNTMMWHPNIYMDGRVCISILHPPGSDPFNPDESADLRWRPIFGVEQILISILLMLNEPNCDSPANIDASVMYKNDPQGYKRKVLEYVQNSLD